MNEDMKKELLAGGIDIDGICKRLPGMEDLIRGLLLKFPNEKCYQGMLDAVEEKDYQKAFEHAHNLKGVSANFEMHPLVEHVSGLVEILRHPETAGDQEAEIGEKLILIGSDYRMVVETINRVLAN